jgi:aminoglycoside phosphotransferase (APT) family kinase protein
LEVILAVKSNDVDSLITTLDVSPLSPPTPVKGGWSDTRLWRVELPDGPHILRIYARHDERIALREAEVLDYLRALDFPVARVVARGSHEEVAYLLLGWVAGQTLGEELGRGGDPRAFGEQFGRLQALLHRVEAPAELPAAVSWPSLEAYPESLLEALDRIPQRRDRLLHLDYHPLNVIVDDGQIAGLIDWTNVRRGDPRFDIARTYLILRAMPRLEVEQFEHFRPVLRSFLISWHQQYRQDMGALCDLPLFLAWAGYGMLFDLGGKSSDLLPAGARIALDRTCAFLERKIESWMRLASLEISDLKS